MQLSMRAQLTGRVGAVGSPAIVLFPALPRHVHQEQCPVSGRPVQAVTACLSAIAPSQPQGPTAPQAAEQNLDTNVQKAAAELGLHLPNARCAVNNRAGFLRDLELFLQFCLTVSFFVSVFVSVFASAPDAPDASPHSAPQLHCSAARDMSMHGSSSICFCLMHLCSQQQDVPQTTSWHLWLCPCSIVLPCRHQRALTMTAITLLRTEVNTAAREKQLQNITVSCVV